MKGEQNKTVAIYIDWTQQRQSLNQIDTSYKLTDEVFKLQKSAYDWASFWWWQHINCISSFFPFLILKLRTEYHSGLFSFFLQSLVQSCRKLPPHFYSRFSEHLVKASQTENDRNAVARSIWLGSKSVRKWTNIIFQF